MIKLTFKLVAATNVNAFNEAVNDHLTKGYRFVSGQPMVVTPHEDISGHGFQYSVAMLLEEEV